MRLHHGPRKALIIGCGIAGPATALFLRRAGIEAEIYEAQGAPDDEAGAFLNLASNGIAVLETLGVADRVAAEGFPCPRMVIWSGRGKRLGEMPNGVAAGREGSPGIMVRRGFLNRAVREQAVGAGIPIQFGKRLVELGCSDERRVVAWFADGTSAEGDFLVACDGIHSPSRRLIMPEASGPEYTGLIGCGGVAKVAGLDPTPGAFHFVFGKRAFFGYMVTESGEAFWFNNTAAAEAPSSSDLNAIPREAWRRHLAELHGDDPAPIPAIVDAIGESFIITPVRDLPSLPAWHRGRVVLLGDAAHATSPHAGQGASMALEDAIVLAKCVRDIPNLEDAFAAFQASRKPRVDALVALARRTGQNKTVTSPLALWLRDLLMPVAFKIMLRSKGDPWGYTYRVDWEQKVA